MVGNVRYDLPVIPAVSSETFGVGAIILKVDINVATGCYYLVASINFLSFLIEDVASKMKPEKQPLYLVHIGLA